MARQLTLLLILSLSLSLLIMNNLRWPGATEVRSARNVCPSAIHAPDSNSRAIAPSLFGFQAVVCAIVQQLTACDDAQNDTFAARSFLGTPSEREPTITEFNEILAIVRGDTTTTMIARCQISLRISKLAQRSGVHRCMEEFIVLNVPDSHMWFKEVVKFIVEIHRRGSRDR